MIRLALIISLMLGSWGNAEEWTWPAHSWTPQPKQTALFNKSIEGNRVVIRAIQNLKMGNEPAMNYRALYKALDKLGKLTPEEKSSGRLNSLNQGQVGSCFVRGTKVVMGDGTEKEIQDVQVGDFVISGEGNKRQVLNTFVKHTDKIIHVFCEGGIEFQCTPDHKVMTPNSYQRADQLTEGDSISTVAQNSKVRIKTIKAERCETLVYDFEVDVDHSYLIEGGLWVHNCVGYATTLALDVLLTLQAEKAHLKQAFKLRVNPNATYAIGREAGNMLMPYDGSTGSASIKGITQIGYLHRQKLGNYDLANIDWRQAKPWGTRGLPLDLKSKIKYKALVCVNLKNAQELKAGLQAGGTALLCASASYDSRRGQYGISRLNGRKWNHALAATSYRHVAGKDLFLIHNSWIRGAKNTEWNSGTIDPPDLPQGAWWAVEEDLNMQIKQGDSYLIVSASSFERLNLTPEQIFSIKGLGLNFGDNVSGFTKEQAAATLTVIEEEGGLQIKNRQPQ